MLVYIVLVLVAFFSYPKNFSPINYTMYELGNPVTNPSGAIFYNAGAFVAVAPVLILVGLILIGGRKQAASYPTSGKVGFYSMVVSLLVFCIFSLITVFVPIGVNNGLNSLCALISFVAFMFFVAFSALGIRMYPAGNVRWVSSMGFAVIAINLILFVLLLAGLVIANWAIVVICWSYIIAFIYDVANIANAG
jgi:hypothetical protein